MCKSMLLSMCGLCSNMGPNPKQEYRDGLQKHSSLRTDIT